MDKLSLTAVACVALVAGPAAAAAPQPAARAAAGDVVLLDFRASWCGPCRQMAPLVEEVAAAGWAVRHVDVDREPDVVRRFGVSGVPCYVLLVQGREAGRIEGATTRGELERLLASSGPALGGAPPTVADPLPATAGIPVAPTAAAAPLATEPPPRPAPPESGAATAAAGPAAAVASGPRLPADPPAAVAELAGPPARDALGRKLLAATARLRVEDSAGVSWGTGTVVDCRQGEALILTCGHIFRDSEGKGRVTVDLFAADGPRGVAGQVVAWDLQRDLALVSIFTDQPLEAVRVGGPERATKPGEPVVTVGCDGGADPTIHHSRITAVDKYLGPANVQVAGQPVQGRSGGGLFAIDGTLIGVCNAADPADNEGLFAALPAIHEQLEEAGLAFVYRNVYPSDGLASAGGSAHVPAMPAEMPEVSFDRRDRAGAVPTTSTAGAAGPVAEAGPPGGAPAAPPAAGADVAVPTPSPATVATPAAASPPLTPGEQALLEQVRRHQGRAEVICIVRPHDAGPGGSEVFVLENAGRDFVEHLSRAHRGPPAADARPAVAEQPGEGVVR